MIALYAAWCGFCWLLRGGKFGAIWRALFKREPGTTVTRIGCSILMGAPLGFIDPAYALLIVSIYAAMTVGYFRESMGLTKPNDMMWLGAWGITVAAIMIFPVALFKTSVVPLIYASLGYLAAVGYDINKSLGRRFGLDWTERAEILTGAAFGLALFLAIQTP